MLLVKRTAIDRAHEDAADELISAFGFLARRGGNKAQITLEEAWLEMRSGTPTMYKDQRSFRDVAAYTIKS